LLHFDVKVVCTTDDPVDDLSYHKKIRQDNFSVKILPTFRPDKILNTLNTEAFQAYIKKLETSSQIEIRDYSSLLDAFRQRHDYFHENGGRLSDHGLEKMFAEDYTSQEIEAILGKLLDGKNLSLKESKQFNSAILYDLALLDHEKGWTQQFHL